MADSSLVLTVEELASMLGISRALAYELVRRGVITSIRLGRRLVVPRRRLLAMIEGHGDEAVADRKHLDA
jgi:excisionase family DNA binding protein